MTNDLWKLTAVEAVALLKKREVSPLDLVEASASRIAEVEPAVNALPTLCLDRARDHARRIMSGSACEASGEPGWLVGLPGGGGLLGWHGLARTTRPLIYRRPSLLSGEEMTSGGLVSSIDLDPAALRSSGSVLLALRGFAPFNRCTRPTRQAPSSRGTGA